MELCGPQGTTFLAVSATDCYRKGAASHRGLLVIFSFKQGRRHGVALYRPGRGDLLLMSLSHGSVHHVKREARIHVVPVWV